MVTSKSPPQPETSGSPPKLDTSTRKLLDDFLGQKKKEKTLFEHLKSRSSSRSTSNTGSNRNSSSSATTSSASSISSARRLKNCNVRPVGRNVSDLLPRGRSNKGGNGEQNDDEDDDSLFAQAEALADLERLNGVEPSIPISALRIEDDNDSNSDVSDDDSGDQDERQPYRMDVDEFRRCCGEDWQLSQFWYSSDFSYRLAHSIDAMLRNVPRHGGVSGTEKTTESATEGEAGSRPEMLRIGFISCPTAYVAFRYLYPEFSPQPVDREDRVKVESFLFEYDERFSVLTPPQSALRDEGMPRFIHYDLNKPLSIPSCLQSQLDMVIIDPPFLNRDTNLKMAQTVKTLVKSEESKVLLITGQSISEQACEIYGNRKTGPLRKAEKLKVEHMGLANDFGAWGNWDGIEDFGSEE